MDNLDKYIVNTLKPEITEHSNYENTIINSFKLLFGFSISFNEFIIVFS